MAIRGVGESNLADALMTTGIRDREQDVMRRAASRGRVGPDGHARSATEPNEIARRARAHLLQAIRHAHDTGLPWLDILQAVIEVQVDDAPPNKADSLRTRDRG